MATFDVASLRLARKESMGFIDARPTETQHRRTQDTYRKLFDTRKRRVRGLWRRNGRWFARIRVGDDLGRKKSPFTVAEGASTVPGP
ncbi:MAG: hypothetical protein AB7O66_17210 [Limisphaerales bacterium]